MKTQRCRIERLSFGPDAIARLEDGKTVFIQRGCPGDVARIEILEEHPSYARARIVELEEPSDERTQSPCPYANRCGGCPWQHIAYPTQLEAKRASLLDALVRIGGFDRTLIETIAGPIAPSQKQWGYRNKVEFEVTSGSALALGMHAYAGDFLRVDECPLLPLLIQKSPGALSGALRYLQGADDLGIERVGIRHSERTHDTEVALWTSPGAFPRARVGRILQDAMQSCGVVRVLRNERKHKRMVKGIEVLEGPGYWRERIAGETLRFSAPSFSQINTAGAESLIDLVLENLAPEPSMTVYDLYSGAGTFTIPLSKHCGHIIAIESYGSAVRDLRVNVEYCSCDTEVIGGDVAYELPGLKRPDAAIIDPPRTGLAKPVIDTLCSLAPPRLCYVSCDPATLARDLKALCAQTYTLKSVDPVDLFPQSFHCETVVMLESRRE